MIFSFFFSLISLHAYSIIVSMSFENHSFVSDDSPYSCFHLGFLDCLERLVDCVGCLMSSDYLLRSTLGLEHCFFLFVLSVKS